MYNYQVWSFKFMCLPPFRQTLPKAQRTRGLSSYHKFKHKSWSNFIFRISTKHQLQLQPNISISTKSSIKLQNLDQILTKIQFHNLYKTSAEKNCPNSSFKILPELQLQNPDQPLCSKSEQKFCFMAGDKIALNKIGSSSQSWVVVATPSSSW